jgi:hypothetical protein
MTCRTVDHELADMARGVVFDAGRQEAIDRHLRECRGCAARLEEEKKLSAALGRLAQATGAPAPDPESERALLAAFDAAWAQPRLVPQPRAWRPLAAAAVVALAASVVWMIASRRADVRAPDAAPPRIAAAAPRVDTPPPPATFARTAPAAATTTVPRTRRAVPAMLDATAFVPWPGAATLPTFESGRLMRLDLPASVAISLGLRPPASQAGVVRADILVGQDGFARAVRLAP